MSKSIFFNEEDIIKSHGYKDAVDADVFLQKIEDLCVYEQDYTYRRVANLEEAEEILLNIRSIMKDN